MHTHTASSCYPKHRHLWDFSERCSHTFCKHTVTMKNRCIMSKHSETVPRKGKVTDTPAANCGRFYTHLMQVHTKLRVECREIKQKINTATKTGGNKWHEECNEQLHTHKHRLFNFLCGDFLLGVIISHIYDPQLFCSHK